MIAADGDHHVRPRKLVAPALASYRTRALLARIGEITRARRSG